MTTMIESLHRASRTLRTEATAIERVAAYLEGNQPEVTPYNRRPLERWSDAYDAYFGNSADVDWFKHVAPRTHDFEGLWANHPEDNGGPTMRGVTIATARAWFGPSFTVEQLRTLTKVEAEQIFYGMFWMKARCHNMPGGIDYLVFDGAVHSGPGRSVSWLQRAVGADPDGIYGPITDELVRLKESHEVVDKVINIRLRFLRQLSDWEHFGNGWATRLRLLGKQVHEDLENAVQ